MFLKEIPKALEAKRARRWIEILPEDASLDCPSVKFNVGYADPKRTESITSRFRKRDGKLDIDGDNAIKFKQAIFEDTVLKGRNGDSRWSGMTIRNIRRMCPVYMEHPELLPETSDTQELDLSDADMIQLAGQMLEDFILDIFNESQKLGEYAREEFSKKNS